MINWETASEVAFTGVVSVFLALGILSIAVYLAGLYFTGWQKTENKERGTDAS